MKVLELDILGLKLISPHLFHDERGFFYESYIETRYKKEGISVSFVQDNIAFSKKGTIRALHFQSSPGQAKLISCLMGKIWDVAVDIRPDSATFGKWRAVELDDIKRSQFFIPVGFAHGYCVLSETALVQYKVSSPYDLENEHSIRWNDPDLLIQWPIQNPILSERDQRSPFFNSLRNCLRIK